MAHGVLHGAEILKGQNFEEITSCFAASASTNHREMYYNLVSRMRNFHADRGSFMQFCMAHRF